MKFLVLFALVAVAAAIPTDEVARDKRQVLWGGVGVPVVRTAGLWAPGSAATIVPANAWNAGEIHTPGASVVGPSTAGHPGVIARNYGLNPWGGLVVV